MFWTLRSRAITLRSEMLFSLSSERFIPFTSEFCVGLPWPRSRRVISWAPGGWRRKQSEGRVSFLPDLRRGVKDKNPGRGFLPKGPLSTIFFNFPPRGPRLYRTALFFFCPGFGAGGGRGE